MGHLALFSILLVAFICGHLFTISQLTLTRHGLIRQTEELAALPPAAIKLLSLDYQNVAADLIFSRTVSFYGGKVDRGEKVDSKTWGLIYDRLKLATELDPYFADPYYFGQSALTWGAGMPEKANALLDQGRRFRTNDWFIPFFMGFNSFYFLHDDAQAGTYLMEASKRPGSSPVVGLLAARLASRSGRIETAILFLRQMELETEDPVAKQDVQDRRVALEGIWVLEQAVERYRQQFGKLPKDLKALVDRGIIQGIPADPYGGAYYLNQEGKVWTTSDLRPIRN